MPSTTDMYFPLSDAEYERSFIANVDFRPIPTIWGQTAGGGSNSADRTFLIEEIRRALRGLKP